MSAAHPWRARFLIAALALLACAVAASTARADFYLEPLPGDGGVDTVLLGLGNTYLCPSAPGCATGPSSGHGGSGSGHPKHHRPAPPRTATAKQLAQLRFKPVASVKSADEQVAVQDLTNDFGPGTDPNAVQAGYEQAVSGYEQNLRAEPQRWSVNNLGDMATFAFLNAYDLYNDTSTPDAGDLVIRREINNELALVPGIRRLSAAHKQRACDALEFNVIYYTVFLAAAGQAGDTTLAGDVQQSLRRWAKGLFGVDVARVKITKRGLFRR